MKLEAQRLRRREGAVSARPRFAGFVVVAALGVLGPAVAPAAAQGNGPEQPPVKAPARLGPEPAPVARAAPPSTPTTTSTSSSASTPTSSASQATPTTTAQQTAVLTSTTSAPPQQRPATSARPKPQVPPAKPRATHAVKTTVRSLAQTIQRPATRIALGAVPAASSDSNRLLFLGGLALLVLVLGDAAFLAFSARVLREQR